MACSPLQAWSIWPRPETDRELYGRQLLPMLLRLAAPPSPATHRPAASSWNPRGRIPAAAPAFLNRVRTFRIASRELLDKLAAPPTFPLTPIPTPASGSSTPISSKANPEDLFIVGGTSLSSPALAGIVNNAGRFFSSSQAENMEIYHHLFSDRDDFRDIVYGNCGINIGDFSLPGWDFCTGVGSNIGLGGK